MTSEELIEQWKESKDKREIEEYIFTRSPRDYEFPLRVEDFVDSSSPGSLELDYIHDEYTMMYGILEDFKVRFFVASEKMSGLNRLTVSSFSRLYKVLKEVVPYSGDYSEMLEWSVAERINPEYLPMSMKVILYEFNSASNSSIFDLIKDCIHVIKIFYKFQIKKGSRQSYAASRGKYTTKILETFKQVDEVISEKVAKADYIGDWFLRFGKANDDNGATGRT